MQDRLFRIVSLLMKHKHMTARQLAEEFEVSTRTIYRDLDALTLAKIPIYTQKGEGGGIYLDEHYVLSSTLMNAQEQASILQGLKLIESVNIRDTKKSSEKLEALFQKSYPDVIKIDFHAWGKDDRQEYLFDHLYEAILTHHLVQFTYFNSMKEKLVRQVEPYQLVFKEQAWYLKAYCLSRQAFRIFKFRRMMDLIILDESFVPREVTFDDDSFYDHTNEKEIILHFKKEVWFQLVDCFSIDMIEELDDCYEVVLHYSIEDWLISWLLSFEDNLEVISPSIMRDKMKAKLIKMNRIYE